MEGTEEVDGLALPSGLHLDIYSAIGHGQETLACYQGEDDAMDAMDAMDALDALVCNGAIAVMIAGPVLSGGQARST